jgi:hypothetical protein
MVTTFSFEMAVIYQNVRRRISEYSYVCTSRVSENAESQRANIVMFGRFMSSKHPLKSVGTDNAT